MQANEPPQPDLHTVCVAVFALIHLAYRAQSAQSVRYTNLLVVAGSYRPSRMHACSRLRVPQPKPTSHPISHGWCALVCTRVGVYVFKLPPLHAGIWQPSRAHKYTSHQYLMRKSRTLFAREIDIPFRGVPIVCHSMCVYVSDFACMLGAFLRVTVHTLSTIVAVYWQSSAQQIFAHAVMPQRQHTPVVQ